MMRGGRTRSSTGEALCNNIAQRLVRVPTNLLGTFSRAMNRGIDLMGIGGGNRRTHHLPHPPNLPSPYHHHPPQPMIVQEEWAFLATFEQQHGSSHPFFYACRFAEALRIARDEGKLMFLYLHLPEHPFTQSFCREALCCELVVQFLDANFVSWAAIAGGGGEGLDVARVLQPGSFPFCAVVAPATGGENMAVLQQIEGPVSPAELVEILQKTMEGQGLASEERNRREEDQLLREEQDVAYLAALQIDQEKDKLRRVPPQHRRAQKQEVETSNKENDEKKEHNPTMKLPISKLHEATTSRETRHEDVTQILIRFPNGERREQSFLSTDKVEAIYGHIDSLGLPGVGNYRLISSFPRKVFDVDQMEMTLMDAGLHPRASIFIELL